MDPSQDDPCSFQSSNLSWAFPAKCQSKQISDSHIKFFDHGHLSLKVPNIEISKDQMSKTLGQNIRRIDATNAKLNIEIKIALFLNSDTKIRLKK